MLQTPSAAPTKFMVPVRHQVRHRMPSGSSANTEMAAAHA
jgi:hypothetical protein